MEASTIVPAGTTAAAPDSVASAAWEGALAVASEGPAAAALASSAASLVFSPIVKALLRESLVFWARPRPPRPRPRVFFRPPRARAAGAAAAELEATLGAAGTGPDGPTVVRGWRGAREEAFPRELVVIPVNWIAPPAARVVERVMRADMVNEW